MEHIITPTKYEHIRAAEQEVAAICPLNCVYCYIPKNETMKKLHTKLLDEIKSGKHIDTLKAHYGENLEEIGLWGTEPTIILYAISEKINEYLEAFPNLKAISFSTSLLTDPKMILKFIEALNKQERKLTIKIQVSLDGPAFITDKNRLIGASEKVPGNLETILDALNKVEYKSASVEFKWKPTISIDNMKSLLSETYLIDAYYGYFKRLNARFNEKNKQSWITLKSETYYPTLVVPGKYTVEDGKTFFMFLKRLHNLGYDTTYTWRIKRLHNWRTQLYKKFMFTCSGGDSNFGVGENLHICHRTFFLEDNEYIDAVLSTDIENWDVSHFESGMLKHIQKNFIIDATNKQDRTRFLYVMRGYHDFWKFEIQTTMSMIKELALANQADVEYLYNDELCENFAVFMISALGCPMENLLNTGSIHLIPVSLIRLWGNGAFQELVRRLKDV